MSVNSVHHQRDLSHNRFGDHTSIYQGDHYHLPHPPARAEVVRVIPYPRNEDLVRRGDLLDRLDKLLPQTPGSHSAALWGLGGSGKTQIALDYAYRRCDADDECCVFWVHADNEATFLADYKTIGKKLGVDERLEGSDLLDVVRSGIEARSKWVMIVDNADDLRLFGVGQQEKGEGTKENENLRKYVPRTSQGTVLWTSRDAHITGTLVGAPRSIEVRAMAMDEATTLLARARDDPSTSKEARVDTLLEELQCLPLAISQAGAYMRRMSMTTEQYLGRLRQGQSRWEVLKMSDADRHRRPEVPNSVLETWRISTERIRVESEMSYGILHVIAYVDSQDIPHELVMAVANRYSVSDKGPTRQATELEVLKAITRLKEFSFLSQRQTEDGGRSYEMHKLVQEAVRYGLVVRDSMETTMGKAPWVESKPSEPENDEAYYSGMALQVVDDLFPPSEPTSWGRCEQYVTHAIRVGEWAEVSGTEIETAALLQRVSRFLYDGGRWREKEPVDKRALDLRREALGEKHLDTIGSMANLGATYHAQGLYDEAEKLKDEALKLRRVMFGEKHPDTISSMANLAATYHAQGRHGEDEEIAVKVLDLRREVLGEKHPDTISSMADLAATYHAQGRYDEAEEIAVKVLGLRREVIGEKHPDTIGSMANLGATYHAQGRQGEAEEIAAKVLDLRREVLGEKHLDTIRSMADLGATYHAQGRYDEDEEIAVKVWGLRREVLGEKHPDTIRSMADLAATYHAQGRYDEAEEIAVKVWGLRRDVLGEKHPDTIGSMADLGATYHAQGRYDEAESIYLKVLDLRREMLGEKHPDTISSMADLAVIYHEQGRYGEAERLKDEALDLRREELGEKHPDTIWSMADLAATYHAQGRYGEAERLHQTALDLRRHVLGESHPHTMQSMAYLASTQEALQQLPSLVESV
ncbi:AAA domain-containing protein [Fusarium falciforme]|uniref:AAA domain-containing protein n=1 Tax=Fusarium falciforme TaxID=195108 RepID=UPI0022FFE612|nr:AAA domain-containing protein [Fusarium falciforme]WAO94547.1 AAA domain-containing protein [Fusarium falciforme]